MLTHPLPALPNGPGHKKSYPDPGISPLALKLLKSGEEVQGDPVDVPGNWHDWPGSWRTVDGEAVLTRSVNVLSSEAGKPAILSLGPVSNFDDTYVNGHFVGRVDSSAHFYWVCERRYRIPAGVLRAGKNVIAVRIFDGLGGGGLYGGPSEDIRLTFP